jgi:hypothetical protein
VLLPSLLGSWVDIADRVQVPAAIAVLSPAVMWLVRYLVRDRDYWREIALKRLETESDVVEAVGKLAETVGTIARQFEKAGPT